MWPFRTRTIRRQEIRRSRAEREGVWYRRVAPPVHLWSGLLTVAVAAVAGWILSAGGDVLSLHEGQRIGRAITTRVDFELDDEQQTIEMRVRARETSPNYYRLDATLLTEINGRLSNVLALAKAHGDGADALRAAARESEVILDDAGLTEIQRLAALEDASEYQNAVDSALRVLRLKPLVDPENPGIRRPAATKALLLDPESSQDRSLRTDQLIFTNDTESVRRAIDDAVAAFREPLRASMAASILEILRVPRSNQTAEEYVRQLYRFDTSRTVAVYEKASDEVPKQYLKYSVGDTLADAGILTADQIALLNVERDAYLAANREAHPLRAQLMSLGRALLAFLIVFGVVAYISLYQRGALSNPIRRAASLVVLLGLFALTRLSFVMLHLPGEATVGFHALAAALLAIVYSHGAVFAITGGLGVLSTLAVQGGVEFFLVLMTVSGIYGIGLMRVRYRGRIVLIGLLAAVAVFGLTFAIQLLGGQAAGFSLIRALWAGGTTLMAAFVIEGVLPGIERVFRLSTGMTLLEWCDANKPLLRMMAAEAPGTFNHSLMVATLAEAAAEEIGANGLLARAGALYHDIGKINKPEYFVENQSAGASRHDKLSPAMSVLIIVGHVKDGIEMAKEYNLPESLHPFIAEHHGTTLVEYFYHAATKQRKTSDPDIAESSFRYPGPRPQSKETAILMLCDAVEGAVRAMSEPTPNRIEDTVSRIVQKRLMDGQLDDCDMTFRELARIEASLVKSLCSIYHGRIAYPSQETRKQPAAS